MQAFHARYLKDMLPHGDVQVKERFFLPNRRKTGFPQSNFFLKFLPVRDMKLLALEPIQTYTRKD